MGATKEVKIWSLPVAKDSYLDDIIEYVRFKNERSWYATISKSNVRYYHIRLDVFDSLIFVTLFGSDLEPWCIYLENLSYII